MTNSLSNLTEEELLALNYELLKNLEDVLENQGFDWEGSLFLKVNKEKIRKLADGTRSLINALDQRAVPGQGVGDSQASVVIEVPDLNQGDSLERIFVSLFVNEGAVISSWEAAVFGLQSYSFGRPVYLQKNHCEELLRSKKNFRNEGFAVVDILSDMIIRRPENTMLKDKFGHELITLRQGAINIRNIRGFVHGDGNAYYAAHSRHLKKVESYDDIFKFSADN